MLLAIALGGAVGALARYGTVVGLGRWLGFGFPWGTLAVNVAGCFAVGVLATAFAERSALSPELRLALLVGLLGGFTTFSAFGLETWRLLEDAQPGRALANALGSVAAGLVAVGAGAAVARWLP